MSTFNDETMRDGLYEILDDLSSELVKAKPGSEEHSRIVNEIRAVSELIFEDYRIAQTQIHNEASRKLEERKFLENARQTENEIEMKEHQAKINSRWAILQNALSNGTIAAVCITGMIINCKSETPLINGVSQWMMKILGAIR